jgi:hypothetical protein
VQQFSVAATYTMHVVRSDDPFTRHARSRALRLRLTIPLRRRKFFLLAPIRTVRASGSRNVCLGRVLLCAPGDHAGGRRGRLNFLGRAARLESWYAAFGARFREDQSHYS